MSYFDPKSLNPEFGKTIFDNLWNRFTGRRFKMGLAGYERRLKAADPSATIEMLRDKTKERDSLVTEMVKLQATAARAARGSETRSSSPLRVSSKEYADIKNNQEARAEFEDGRKAAQARSADLAIGELVESYRQEKDTGATKTRVTKLLNKSELNKNQLLGYRGIVVSKLKKAGVAKAIIQDALAESPLTMSDQDVKIATGQFVEGTSQTAKQLAYNKSIRSGGTRTSRRLGTQIDITPQLDFFKNRIKMLDSEIKNLQARVDVESDEYKRLLRGPDRNLMIAPVAVGGSRTGEILDAFSNLQAQDPQFGNELTAASDEAGRFAPPTPYEELLRVPGAAGKSAFDVMFEQSNLITQLNIDSIIDDTSRSQISSEDVDLIANAVEKMNKSAGDRMFDTIDFGKMRTAIGTSQEKEVDAKEAISNLSEAFKLAKTDEQKRMVAQSAADTLSAWETTLTPEAIDDKRRKSRPGMGIASKIRKATDEYKVFQRTGDARNYRSSVSDLYNTVSGTDSEIRGPVGDAVLNEIDNFMATDESKRRPGQLNSKLSGLADVVERLAAEEILGTSRVDVSGLYKADPPIGTELVPKAGEYQETGKEP